MNEIDTVPTFPPTADQPVATARALEVDVREQSGAWSRDEPNVVALCRRAALATVHCVAEGAGPATEISLVLADDAFVRDLNQRYRRRDTATNVLSFPAGDWEPGSAGPAVADPLMLGDVVLAYETVAREASEQSKSLADHLVHLVVHGILHLLGFDHENDPDAAAMQSMETRVLDGLGIADPYRIEAGHAVDPTQGRPT